MRIKITIGLILILCIVGCEKLNLKEDVPKCIEDKIREFRKSALSCDSDSQVIRYNFQGINVYVFDPGNCGADMSAPVYDDQCNTICTLGGLGGNVICNGERFDEKATDATLIWEN